MASERFALSLWNFNKKKKMSMPVCSSNREDTCFCVPPEPRVRHLLARVTSETSIHMRMNQYNLINRLIIYEAVTIALLYMTSQGGKDKGGLERHLIIYDTLQRY